MENRGTEFDFGHVDKASGLSGNRVLEIRVEGFLCIVYKEKTVQGRESG